MKNTLIKILEAERNHLLRKLRLMDEALSTYKNKDTTMPATEHQTGLLSVNGMASGTSAVDFALLEKYPGYIPYGSARNNSLVIIRTENRFMHVREIVKVALQIEGTSSASGLMKKISPALSSLKKMPGSPLVSINVAHSYFNTFWGLQEWLNDNGEVRQPFLYNEAEIKRPVRTRLHQLP